jgi:hypothetical protein
MGDATDQLLRGLKCLHFPLFFADLTPATISPGPNLSLPVFVPISSGKAKKHSHIGGGVME